MNKNNIGVLDVMPNAVVKVENISKVYKLYNTPVDRLKESLHPLRKKYYHDFHALHNVNFEIYKGETVGIIGPNGSGKSTLLKIITGVITPTTGNIVVNGKVSALLELGAGFNPELTGIENVYFNGTLLGYSKEEVDERLDSILSFADIGQYIYQPVRTYSSGMFVRLAFALAINVDPDILIVDEALSVGDIRFQRKCYSKIAEFKENGKTIIFVTHDAGTVVNICSKAILMCNGELQFMGQPKIVTKKYMELIFSQNSSPLRDGESKSVFDTPFRKEVKQRIAEELNLSPHVQNTSEMRHGNGRLEIIDFCIKDIHGKRVTNLESGGKYSFNMLALNYEDLEEIFFAFLVRNAQGIELSVANTELNNIQIVKQAALTIFEVTADIHMCLGEGEYFLSFVSFDKNRVSYLDRRLDALYFSVVDYESKSKGFVNMMPDMKVNVTRYKPDR